MKVLPPKSDLINTLDNISLFSTLNKSNVALSDSFSNLFLLDSKKFVQDMLNGKKVNFTETIETSHFSARFFNSKIKSSPYINNKISNEIKSMLLLANKIRNGEFGSVKDIIHIGTGGSNLGPKMIYDAFRYKINGPDFHFISNVDPFTLSNVVKNLNPNTTLIFIVSKSFTTTETLFNLKRVKLWLKSFLDESVIMKKIFAITSSYNKAIRNDFLPSNIITFDKSIGGRFSIWSAANISTPILFGEKFFLNFLKGGNIIDEQVINNFANSLSFNMAIRSHYNINFKKEYSHCIVPYSDSLKLLPLYLQQLMMESNGKSINKDLKKVNSPTSNVFGYVGTDAQHSFFQSLHQSTLKTSIDLICFDQIYPQDYYIDEELDKLAYDQLKLNCFSQYLALKKGSIDYSLSNSYKTVEGNKSVNLLLFDKITENTLGKIICLYEYKTIIEASFAKINPFDQFGVKLGKDILKKNN